MFVIDRNGRRRRIDEENSIHAKIKIKGRSRKKK
jgi:hypothetical protein